MKTQCPHCKAIFDVPPEYKDKKVKCRRCDKDFKPVKFKKPPIVIPNLPSRGNFLTKLWTKSPTAFKTGFLATLGVITALWLAWYIFGSANRLRRPIMNQPIYRPPVSMESAMKRLTAENVCALIQLFRHSHELETIQNISRKLGKNIIKNPSTFSRNGMIEVFATITDRLETNAKELSRLRLPHDPQIADPSFEQVRNAYIDATRAEIDTINGLIRGLETGKFGSDWQQTLDKTVNLGNEASIQLIFLMFEIDENLVKIFSESKK